MKVPIPSFRIREFSEDHLFNFGEKAILLLSGFSSEDLMSHLAASLAELHRELGQRIGRLPSNPIAEQKSQADKKRDALKVRVYEATRIAAEDPESEAVRAAAAVIQEVLDRRPAGFQNLIYEENTTQLNQLLADLAEPSVRQAADHAGLTKWINALAASETAFETADKAFDEYERKTPKPRQLTEIRRDFNETLRVVLDTLAWAANRLGSESRYAEAFRGLRGELVALSSLAKLRDTADAKREKKAGAKKAELTS
jgi:small-conductance mechanosensitive channel